MELKIYSGDGVLKLSVEPRDNGTQVEEIQAGNVLTLSFTMPERIFLEVNDYVDFMGRRYWLTEKYRPVQKSTVEWEYSLKFYGLENLISRFLVLNDTDGANEPVFALTASPREHVALIVKSINAGFGTNDWKVGTVEAGDNIVVDYHGKYCNEGLKAVAEMIGTEYWIEGTTVNLCRCEHGERIALGYQNGLTKIQPDVADNAKVYTRLFPVGSSKNIDPAKYGYNRLQLPGGMQYVDINTDKYGIIHHYEENAFADIFPRYTGTITGVRSEEHTDDSGDKFTVYYFKDEALPFDPNQYDLGGLVKRVTFQEGSELAGLGNDDSGTHYFEVNFNSETWEFEIITQFNDAGALPGGILIPRPGDRYIPWNMRMPDEYYALAEAELLDAVQEYNCLHSIDVACYKVSTDYEELEKRGIDLHVGQRVRFVSSDYFPETGYKDSRITKITRKINCPAQMDLEISDALSTGAIDQIKGSIDEVKAYARAVRAGVPDIVKTGDNTPFTDNNLLSALRSCREFLSKLKDDRAKGKIASDIGFEVGNYLAGVSGGMFGIDKVTGDSFAEVMRLYVRGKAYFETLTIIEANTLAGKQYITPGGSIKCSKVEAIKDENGNVTAYRCYFLSEQDGEKTETKIVVGDQAISEMFNAKAGTTNKVSNHRYWRLVTAVDNDAYTDESGNHYGYIDLSSTDCEAGSDIPHEGDVIDQLGNRNDRTRQAAMIFSTVDADAPSIKLLTGIDSYTFVNKDVISQGYDPAKGSAFFKCFGDVYLGSRNGSTYVKYDEAADAFDIKARISALSTIGDKALNQYFTDLIPEIPEEYDDTEIKTEIGRYKYLRNALLPENPTQITGGLIMSTLISLGYTDDTGLRHTLAGVNGSWINALKGRTIASWYGGDMVDLFDPNDNRINPIPANAATSLIRMDGSAYFAGGNIGFRADGSGWLGSDLNGIKFGTDGSMMFGNGIKINLASGEEGLAETLESVLNMTNGLSSLLVPVDEDGNELDWRHAATAVALKARKNFCSDGDMVSGGWQTPGEGDVPVVAALSDLTDVQLAGLAVGDLIQWNGTDWVNVKASELGLGGSVDLSNVMRGVSLDKTGDFDADALSDQYVIYDPTGDMQNGSGTWTHFPGVKPNGGFTLINLKEGGYAKQLYTEYNSNRLYIRNTHWDATARAAAWSAWDSFALMSDLGKYVTLDTAQTITGAKAFTSALQVQQLMFQYGNEINATSGRIVIGYRDTPNGVNLCYNNTPLTYGSAAHQIWHAGNDGAGSGLDADLLDGLHAGAFVRNITASVATVNNTNLNPQIINIENETLITGYGAYWNVVNLGSYSNGNFRTQLAMPYQNSLTDTELFIRSANNAAWRDWRRVIHVGNYASIIDARYVKKAGDTMTGSLTMAGNIYMQTGSVLQFKENNWGDKFGIWGAFNGADDENKMYIGSAVGGQYTDPALSVKVTMLLKSGNWGFGTSSPLDKVHVHGGNIRMSYASDNRYMNVGCGGFAFYATSTTGWAGGLNVYTNSGTHLGTSAGYYGNKDALNYMFYGGTYTSPVMVILPNKKIGVGTTNPLYEFDVNGGIIATAWVRTRGSTGWYSETYGGGWYMTDETWIRAFNGKGIYTTSTIRSDYCFSRYGYGGSSWGNGHGALNVAITNNSAQTPLLLAFRDGSSAASATGANRLFSMEFLNAGTALRLYFGGVHRFTFYSNGNFESAGDQAANSSSDRRLKQRFAVEDYTARIMRLGAVMDYEWSDKARALDPGKYDAVRHSSVVWQRARKVGIPRFCGVDGRGYGFVNWLNKDYQASLLGAVQETIRTVRRHDDEIRQLYRHVGELEGIVNNKCA